MQKIVLTFGLIAGAILSAMMLATIPFLDRIGFEHSTVIGYTTMVIAFLMVYFGVRSTATTSPAAASASAAPSRSAC